MEWHPFAAKFPLLEGEEWKAFKESIRKTKGNEVPVVYRMVKGNRQGIDGRNRELACLELKLECTYEKRFFEDEAEVRDFILRRNVLRRHMSKELRQEIVGELHADGQSTRQIAGTLGVGKSTVERDIRQLTHKQPPVPNGPKKTSEVAESTAREPGDDYHAEGEPGHGKDIRLAIPRDPNLPKSVANALADTWHADCALLLSKMATQCKSAFSWSSWLDPAVLDHLKAAEDYFLTAVPKKVCPDCKGKKIIDNKACLTCRQGGYLASQC
jgi:transposase-like protein